MGARDRWFESSQLDMNDGKEKPCLGRFETHSWYSWEPYDPIHELKWKYRRACSLMGCNAVEYAQNLKVDGESVVGEYGKIPE